MFFLLTRQLNVFILLSDFCVTYSCQYPFNSLCLSCFALETAVNIGFSCRLLTEELEEVFTVDGECRDDVFNQLNRARAIMSGDLEPAVEELPPDDGVQTAAAEPVEVVTYSNGSLMAPVSVAAAKNGKSGLATRFCIPEDANRYALVINGHSLVS